MPELCIGIGIEAKIQFVLAVVIILETPEFVPHREIQCSRSFVPAAAIIVGTERAIVGNICLSRKKLFSAVREFWSVAKLLLKSAASIILCAVLWITNVSVAGSGLYIYSNNQQRIIQRLQKQTLETDKNSCRLFVFVAEECRGCNGRSRMDVWSCQSRKCYHIGLP